MTTPVKPLQLISKNPKFCSHPSFQAKNKDQSSSTHLCITILWSRPLTRPAETPDGVSKRRSPC
jgi:hypothetical protein